MIRLRRDLKNCYVCGISICSVISLALILRAHRDTFMNVYKNAASNTAELLTISEIQNLNRNRANRFQNVNHIHKRTLYPAAFDLKYVINNMTLCETQVNLNFVVIIHSSTKYANRRQAIRQTWGNQRIFKKVNFRLVFMLGLTKNAHTQERIETESRLHGDIVQGDFVDTYRNLTYKGLLAYRWITEYCNHAAMVLKTDDDVFVNPFILMETYYPMLKARDRQIICHLRYKGESEIVREDKKWRIHEDQFKGYIDYPFEHCNGYFVIMSPEIVPLLYKASYTTPFFWVDDVYLFGLLPLKVGHVTFVNIRDNMTLIEEKALACYASGYCPFVAVNSYREGRAMKFWYAASHQIDSSMRKKVNWKLLSQL